MNINTDKLYPLIVTLAVLAASVGLVVAGKLNGEAGIALVSAVMMGALGGWLRSPSQGSS